jgi:aryl-alcohol dehydrogenase
LGVVRSQLTALVHDRQEEATIMRVAIARERGTTFTIEDGTLDQPRGDEVLVRIKGVGICRSDVAAAEQQLPFPLPAVLGHEGAGIVEAIGPDVTKLAVGDRVVLTFMSCGQCRSCARDEPAYCVEFRSQNLAGTRADGTTAVHVHGSPVSSFFFGQSSFGDCALAHERNAVKVPDGIPLELLGPLGCGIQTGAGAIMRSLAARGGSSLLVLGAGTVGLAAVMGAVVQGCNTIIVSEPHASRRALALELGATHALDPTAEDLVTVVQAAAPGGVDYAFDTSARATVLEAALACLANGGTLGLVGVPADPATTLSTNVMRFIGRGLTIRGIVEGDSNPETFIPELIELFRIGASRSINL